jgi:hypothetical protein
MEQAVFVAEPTEEYDMLNSSDRSASYNTGVTDSEIEQYGDEDEDEAGITYTGTRKIGAHTMMGKPPVLATDSIEAQIIADCLESGWSLSLSQWMVNQHRKEAQEESLTLAPIRHLMKRLKPVIRKVKKQKRQLSR